MFITSKICVLFLNVVIFLISIGFLLSVFILNILILTVHLNNILILKYTTYDRQIIVELIVNYYL